MTTAQQPAATASLYIGKCKTKGCKCALRIDYRDLQEVTYAQYEARKFDASSGFKINNVRPFGYCNDHGAYPLSLLRGRVLPDHECDGRCTSATGDKCNCSCGGANHGAAHA